MHNSACTAEVFTYHQEAHRVKEGSNTITNWSKALQANDSINSSSRKFSRWDFYNYL